MKKISAILLVLISLFLISAEGKGKRYKPRDFVPFYVNKIGPFANPSESYEYYSLPFCPAEEVQHKHHTIGEDLTGDHKKTARYEIRFKTPINFQSLCTVHFNQEEIKKLQNAIDQHYYWEMTYDDLPIHGFVGVFDVDEDIEEKTYYLYTHLIFTILYNKDQVIFINATADTSKLIPLDKEGNFEFSYEAEWVETTIPYKDREKLYINPASKDMEIHWLSIINSLVLVVLLTGFLSIIVMRILCNDFTRYSKAEDEEDEQEDYGWKLVHGDVFRFPQMKLLFCSLIGLGTQALAVIFSLLFLALFGIFYPNNNGSIYVAGIVLYAFTSSIGGFYSASYYKQMGGNHWQWSIVLVSLLFLIPVLVVFSFVNTTALIHNVTTAVPAGSIAWAVFMLVILGFPLTVFGGIAGRRISSNFDAPTRTKNFPREIPPTPIYRTLPCQMVIAGFLPFSAIYIELFYLFSSVWGHNTYQLFGILFLVAIILLIVTACITISLTYFQLSMEDHRWWWNAFLNGGSSGIFVYLYSIYFYVYKSKMSGFLQGSFYFLYMFIICYFFFIAMGTVGFYSSLIFVRRIYRGLKTD